MCHGNRNKEAQIKDKWAEWAMEFIAVAHCQGFPCASGWHKENRKGRPAERWTN